MTSTAVSEKPPTTSESVNQTSSDKPLSYSWTTSTVTSVPANTRYTSQNAMKRLSELLGRSISKATFWRWLSRRNNPLPAHKPAGRLVFIESELATWANTKRKGVDLL